MVILDQEPDWEKVYEIKKDDRREGGRIHLFLGDKVTIENLFNVSLVSSANTATLALVHALDLTEAEFVDLMNAKAKDLGLTKTHFADSVGLSSEMFLLPENWHYLVKRLFLKRLLKNT